MNGKVNGPRTFYAKELKESLDSKKSGAGWVTPTSLNGTIFKLIWVCKNQIFDSENVSTLFDQINLTVY